MKRSFQILHCLLLVHFSVALFAQDTDDSLQHRNLYRPSSQRIQNDTQEMKQPVDRTQTQYQYHTSPVDTTRTIVLSDSANERMQYVQDSIDARMLFIQDSIIKREAFVRDSIEKRQAFIRDSIAKRERRIDSLNFLVEKLPVLIEASVKANSDFIIVKQSKLMREADTALSDLNFELLPFNLDKPYQPWRQNFSFKDKSVVIKTDTIIGQVTQIKTSSFVYDYTYPSNNLILMNGREVVLKKRTGDLYKVPIDSVFLDNQGRVAKIKKYVHYFQLVNNKKGPSYFIHLDEVKQYTYSSGQTISEMEVVKFADRWRPYDPVNVSSIFNYYIERNGSKILVRRTQRPINDFADGVFTYNYYPNGILESISFNNNKNTENWKTIIETNENGDATRYLYQSKGVVSRTLLINYNDDPKAKYKVETITCNFDKDGISIYQYNNTTGKSRSRNRMTLEWSDWQ